MFIIQTEGDRKNEVINWPVTVETIVDGGKTKKYKFTGLFRRLDDDEAEAIDAELKVSGADTGSEGDGSNAWKDRNIDAVMRVMEGWKGVVDQNKNPIEFTRDNLRIAARSIDGVPILRAINTAINEITTGVLAKN